MLHTSTDNLNKVEDRCLGGIRLCACTYTTMQTIKSAQKTCTGAQTQWTRAQESIQLRARIFLRICNACSGWTFCATDTKITAMFRVVSDCYLQRGTNRTRKLLISVYYSDLGALNAVAKMEQFECIQSPTSHWQNFVLTWYDLSFMCHCTTYTRHQIFHTNLASHPKIHQFQFVLVQKQIEGSWLRLQH